MDTVETAMVTQTVLAAVLCDRKARVSNSYEKAVSEWILGFVVRRGEPQRGANARVNEIYI